MAKPSNLEVNAAIKLLIESDNFEPEAARLIIEFCQDVKPASEYGMSYESFSSGGDATHGYSPGIGDVKISDEKPKHVQHAFFDHEERVGHYKLKYFTEGRIEIRHFWKSSETTAGISGTLSRTYVLFFNRKTLEPKSLAIRLFGPWHTIFILPISWRSMLRFKIQLRYYYFIWGQNRSKKKFDDMGFELHVRS